ITTASGMSRIGRKYRLAPINGTPPIRAINPAMGTAELCRKRSWLTRNMLPSRDPRRFGGLRGLYPRIALYWLVMRGAATLRRVRDGPDLRTPPRAAKTPRSSWRGRVKSDRRVVIRPSGLFVGALLVLAAL